MLTVTAFLLMSGVPMGICEDVLMVIGGQFFNTTSRHHQALDSVEVIGKTKTCEIQGLPTPLYGMSAVRVADTVLVCGGFHYYYRWQCYEYSARGKQWRETTFRLDSPTGFPSAISAGGVVYTAGGRDFVQGDGRSKEDWSYEDSLKILNGNSWSKISNLPEELADTCMVLTTHNNRERLWILGGSNVPQRYKTEVFAIDLNSGQGNWTAMPELPDPRMWPACTVTVIEGELGILVAGGYYNGITSMWLPLADRNGDSLEIFGLERNLPRWEWLSSLTMARKWGPALGYIEDNLALAGGGDYGDNTVEVLEGRDWKRSKVVMKYKREFTAGVTVPSEWFPECTF